MWGDLLSALNGVNIPRFHLKAIWWGPRIKWIGVNIFLRRKNLKVIGGEYRLPIGYIEYKIGPKGGCRFHRNSVVGNPLSLGG